MLLVITDGASTGGITSLRTPVKDLVDLRVNIFSVGVGNGLIKSELEFMASEPKNSHVFYVRDMAELPNLLHTLAQSSCQGKVWYGFYRMVRLTLCCEIGKCGRK